MSLDVYLYEKGECVYQSNITHNLNTMAKEASLYEALWEPDTIGIKQAKQLIEILEKGLQLLIHEPTRFKQFEPLNGWGSYRGLCEFVAEYLEACQHYPHAEAKVWR